MSAIQHSEIHGNGKDQHRIEKDRVEWNGIEWNTIE